MDYNNYKVADFILDESFQNWVLHPETDAGARTFWEHWVREHPEKEELIQQAAHWLQHFKTIEKPLPTARVEEAWISLQQALQEKQRFTIQPTANDGWYKWARQLAAVFIGLLMVAAGIWYGNYRFGSQVYTTAFGETKTLSLPDHSTVVLNGNSSLHYANYWSESKQREVWLEGEAYFAVSHQPNQRANNAKFRVNTSDLNIEVLGTRFNVTRRLNKTNVVLSEGKVRLNIKNRSTPTQLVMVPGQSVEYRKREDSIIKKTVNPAVYTSWKNKKLVFENTPLREVADRIEATYGLKVVVTNSNELNRKLTGTIPTENLDILLLALSKSYKLDIVKEPGRIIIK